MSDFVTKTNEGALFRNDKVASDTSPTHGGSLNVEGVEYYINAWTNKSAAGKGYFKLSVKRKGEQVASTLAPAETEDFNDDIPF